MGLREIGCEVVAWVHSAQDRDYWRAFVNTVISRHAQKRLEFLDKFSDC
jgi:hypothetical protein